MFPENLCEKDSINDQIWRHLHSENLDALEVLNPKKFGIELIKEEIKSGCSPCPDILTENFGKSISVMFVSTVYGLIHNYLQKNYPRNNTSWKEFTQDFFSKIIQKGIGIYPRLERIYDIVSSKYNCSPEVCFTELVKTVMVNHQKKVSGLETGDSFIKYFLEYEKKFLKDRISQIEGKCIIFTFSEISTFYTVVHNDVLQVKRIPENIEIYYSESDEINFRSTIKRNGSISVSVTGHDTYSKSIAFKTIFKIKESDIYIIPLPHPSRANNAYWSEFTAWPQLRKLIENLP